MCAIIYQMNKIRITNKQARFNYELLEDYEAGLMLAGDEIKAIRDRRVNLAGSYAKILYSKDSKPEVFLVGAHFKSDTIDPYRTRKLLLHKKEITHLLGKIQEKNLTLVPVTVYMKKGRAKLQISLARGKKNFDKREAIKKRDLERSESRRIKK